MNEDEIKSALNITTISTDPDIYEPLLYASWTVKEGLLCLVGISEWYADENNVNYLVTFDNVHYSEKDSKEIYDAFIAKYSRLKRIWESSHSEEKYPKEYFIEWALQDKNICSITWLDDAKNKGYVPADIFPPTEKNVGTTTETDLSDREKTSLLKIIAGLAAGGYRYPSRGALTDMIKDFEKNGCGVIENTLSKYLKEAKQYLPANQRKT